MYTKTIGVYLPTHNRVDLLKVALNSLFKQTYSNFKVVVVDDASTDGTSAYLESIVDERISYIRNEKPKGACFSRNLAINLLNTELVTGLDDDDAFLPNRLEVLVSNYTDIYSFVCSGYYWNYGARKKALFANNKIVSLSDAFDLNQCSNQILVKRERVLAVGGYDEVMPALQDNDLWVRLIAQYGKAYRIGKPLYIVNDDHSFERVSSIKNKIKALELFEDKHRELMKERNKENILFYKNKILGRKFGFVELVSSVKYGLVLLKLRFFFSNLFKNFSKARLQYLKTGSVTISFTELLKKKTMYIVPFIFFCMCIVYLLAY